MIEFLMTFVVLPLMCIIVTPFVALYALFTGGAYGKKLRSAYAAIFEAWARTP